MPLKPCSCASCLCGRQVHNGSTSCGYGCYEWFASLEQWSAATRSIVVQKACREGLAQLNVACSVALVLRLMLTSRKGDQQTHSLG